MMGKGRMRTALWREGRIEGKISGRNSGTFARQYDANAGETRRENKWMVHNRPPGCLRKPVLMRGVFPRLL